jgi:hypothetical protein
MPRAASFMDLWIIITDIAEDRMKANYGVGDALK